MTESNIEEDDWTVSNSNNTVSEETVVKVMGVQWGRMEDNFEFDLATFSRLAVLLDSMTVTSYLTLEVHVQRNLSLKTWLA